VLLCDCVSSMFLRLRLSALLVVVVFLLPGCGALGRLVPWKKKPPKATLKIDQMMGTVAMVDLDSAFVLIDNGTLPGAMAGTILKIHSAGVPVELRVTQIRKPPYVVADIVKGTPKKGDAVYQ
jgi:hypothetical protein